MNKLLPFVLIFIVLFSAHAFACNLAEHKHYAADASGHIVLTDDAGIGKSSLLKDNPSR